MHRDCAECESVIEMQAKLSGDFSASTSACSDI